MNCADLANDCARRGDDYRASLQLHPKACGIPRRLNVYCDNALINGLGHGAPRITLRIAREAVYSLELKPPAAARARTAAACGLAALVAGGVVLYPVSETSHRDPVLADSASSVHASSTVPPSPLPMLRPTKATVTLTEPKHSVVPPTAKPATTGRAPTAAPMHRVLASPAPSPPANATAAAARSPRPMSAAPASATRQLSDAEIALLLARGDDMPRVGDVASARLFYERAADAGAGQAALRLALTFDPAFLARIGTRLMAGDPAKANFWYGRARALGAVGGPPSTLESGINGAENSR
jgi:hypothetical protein